MGGLFGVASKTDCVMDLFFGTDYHSHLGTKKGGLAVYQKTGIKRIIHNIENSPFRTKFENDVTKLTGFLGIGCISDSDSQPLYVHSHLGEYAIATVGKLDNIEELIELVFQKRTTHFVELSSGEINSTELTAIMIDRCDTFEDGIRYVQERIRGSLSILILTKDKIIVARDKYGRTPLVIGKKEDGYCVSFESFAYFNLGYETHRIVGPGEIIHLTPEECISVSPALDRLKICAFLWVYYGYPCSDYEGIPVETVRYASGERLAARDAETDMTRADFAAGIPDSGTACAIGYSNASGIPFARPFIKYTPTWPRSFMPQDQRTRNLIAKMKLIPVHSLIKGKKLLFCDDSIVRGTQLRETVDFLYRNGAAEVHIRPACPPLLYGCPFLNFSRNRSAMDLITRQIIHEKENGVITDTVLNEYADPHSDKYEAMIRGIREKLNLTSLRFLSVEDLIAAIGLPPEYICTHCWNGKL